MLTPKVSQVIIFELKEELTKEPEQFKSRIIDEVDDTLTIELPINVKTGKMRRLRTGDVLSVTFLTSEGLKHFFETFVSKTSAAQHNGLPQYEIIKPLPDELTAIQRRNFFRISIECDIAIKRKNGERLVCKTDDIGGGGVSFVTDERSFQDGEILNCWVLLPRKNGSPDHSNFVGEIIRQKNNEFGKNLVMLKFNKITENERQRIIRFLFEKQIQHRER